MDHDREKKINNKMNPGRGDGGVRQKLLLLLLAPNKGDK